MKSNKSKDKMKVLLEKQQKLKDELYGIFPHSNVALQQPDKKEALILIQNPIVQGPVQIKNCATIKIEAKNPDKIFLYVLPLPFKIGGSRLHQFTFKKKIPKGMRELLFVLHRKMGIVARWDYYEGIVGSKCSSEQGQVPVFTWVYTVADQEADATPKNRPSIFICRNMDALDNAGRETAKRFAKINGWSRLKFIHYPDPQY